MKRIYLFLFAWMVAACAPQAIPTAPPALIISTAVPRERVSPAPTWTDSIPPTATEIQAAIKPLGVTQPSPAGSNCLQGLEPPEGTIFPKHSIPDLKWQAVDGAAYYIVLLDHPGGLQEKLVSPGPELLVNLKAPKEPALYRWSVQLYDAANHLLCSSATYSFTLYPEPVVPTSTSGGATSSASSATGQAVSP